MSESLQNTSSAPHEDVGKTALYYEYTSVDFKKNNVIENTLTALLKDREVTDENIRKVTYYLVQKFFIKSANDKKENIELISQIPGAFRKMVDSASKNGGNKFLLVKLFNIYLTHTISTQEDQVDLFEAHSTELREFRHNLTQTGDSRQNIVHSKEVVIEQIYQYIDSINFSVKVRNQTSIERARKKMDQWMTKIYENHVIKGAADVAVALEDYCREEADQSRKRIDFLKKYSKLNGKKISDEIIKNPSIGAIDEAWPLITENIFMYIDNLTKEHGDYKKFLEEIFTPLDENFENYFFNHFFLISALQRQTEKDIYLLEKTFTDLNLIGKYRQFFTVKIHDQVKESTEKAYYIENYFYKSIFSIKGPQKNTFAYLALKYLLEETLEVLQQASNPGDTLVTAYKRAFTDFTRPKYPKFLDNLIFVFLKQSKELERKVGNTQKSYANTYQKDVTLLRSVLIHLGLQDGYQRSILPCLTGFEQSNQILKNH